MGVAVEYGDRGKPDMIMGMRFTFIVFLALVSLTGYLLPVQKCHS